MGILTFFTIGTCLCQLLLRKTFLAKLWWRHPQFNFVSLSLSAVIATFLPNNWVASFSASSLIIFHYTDYRVMSFSNQAVQSSLLVSGTKYHAMSRLHHPVSCAAVFWRRICFTRSFADFLLCQWIDLCHCRLLCCLRTYLLTYIADIRECTWKCLAGDSCVCVCGWCRHWRWGRESDVFAVDSQLPSAALWPCPPDWPCPGVCECSAGAHHDTDWALCDKSSHLQG